MTELVDEASNVTVTYTDVNGNTILRRRIITSQVVDGSTENCLDTYYIYDDAGELRVIVPPKALSLVRNANASPWNISLSAASTLLFQYNYDAQGRLIEKKVPSSDWIYIVYDPMGRPVLTQDGTLRGPSNNINKWSYYKYDSKGTVVTQGIYKDAINGTSRGSIQAYVNALNYSVTYYEGKQTGSFLNYYTNTVFPTVNQDGTALTSLLYYYYDNYDFNADGFSDYAFQIQGLSGEATATCRLSERSANDRS